MNKATLMVHDADYNKEEALVHEMLPQQSPELPNLLSHERYTCILVQHLAMQNE